MKKCKISVIVAAYNVEKYIKKCIDSLLNQTMEEIEIIVVDDASQDKTLEILKQYEKQIILLQNEENKGLSYSRNKALKKASGDYIGYIDADDYVDENFYAELYHSLVKNQADISICDMKLFYEEKGTYQIVSAKTEEEEPICFINTGIAASACNKLIKKELISNYFFADGKVNEDIAVIIPLLAKAKKVAYVSNTYYYYVQRENSIQNAQFSLKRFDIFDGVKTTLERIDKQNNYEKIKEAILYNQIIALLLFVFPKIENAKKRKEFLKKYIELSKPYHLTTNHYFQEYLKTLDGKRKLFFKYLVRLVEKGNARLSSDLIGVLQLYQSGQKNVIKEVNDDILVKLARQNQTCDDQGITISVVIPNYNYKIYLAERLYSILSQKVKIKEIILLDDCSKDNSQEKIEHYYQLLKPILKVQVAFNQTNSGSAFKQWKKGFEMSSGDYLWIAEADDYCSSNLLKELIKPIQKNKDVVISYSDTAYINQKGKIILPSIRHEIDILNTHHFDHCFISNGKEEIKKYAYLNCTIANVSSALIKKGNYEKYLEECITFKQAGDWLFYLQVMSEGNIAYSNKRYNYYRMHGNNVSSTFKKEEHLKEIKRIHAFIEKKWGLNEEQKKEIQKRYSFLQKAWNLKGESKNENR